MNDRSRAGRQGRVFRSGEAWGRRLLLVGLACRFLSGGVQGQEESEPAPVDTSKLPPPADVQIDFDRDIQPILEATCLRCHGPERPRSRFRLDNRESALKGGANGVDIIPGQSANSPLIHYVARLVEGMEMPPEDRGDPLTPEQIGLLRAWIDQGVPWSEGPALAGRPQFSMTASIRWFSVDGDENRFREHRWMTDGWSGGVDQFSYREQLSLDEVLLITGRGDFGDRDYRLNLLYQKNDFGFIRAGFEQFRKYYDDSGGYYPGFEPAYFHLDEDLHLDIGRSWIDFGLTRPHWPRVVLGYEHQYREGEKSTLQWGSVGTPGGETKKIFPSAKQVDEEAHILKLTVSHELPWFSFEDQFRAEFYDLKTRRNNGAGYNLGTGSLEKLVLVREDYDHFQAANTLRLEKQALDWLFLSGGYLYSRLDGEASLGVQTISPANLFAADDKFWFADHIVLDQEAHVFNVNALAGPWEGLTVSAGIQNEWMWQKGSGDVRLDEGIPGTIVGIPAFVDSDIEKVATEERVGLRYTRIPFTVLYAEGRFQQESIGQFEEQIGGAHEFLRDTDAESDLKEGRIGFQISPWPRVSLQAHYRRKWKESDYDHDRDESFGAKHEGYSAFIQERDLKMHEVQAKLIYRPTTWLKTTFTFQQVATDFHTVTDPYIIPEVVIPGLPPLPAEEITPGGSIFAGNYDAQIYSFSASLNPFRRAYFTGTFSYRDTRTVTKHRHHPAVAPFDGDVFSVISSLTYILNEATDLHASYSYSWADYEQRNAPAGLPLGLGYDWHGAHVGITRRINKNLTAQLQYRIYYYDETVSGDANDYLAHGVYAGLSMVLP